MKGFAILAVVMLAAACGGQQPADERPIDELETCSSGHSPAVFAVDRQSGSLQWSFCPDGQSAALLLAATESLVYVTVATPPDDVAVVALDARTGKERWRAEPAGVAWAPGPFTGGGVVVLYRTPGPTDGRVRGELAGLDADTGKVRWQIPDGSFIVAHTDDVVVTRSATGDRRIRGLDRSTGRERWVSDVRFDDRSGVGVLRSAAAASGDVVVVPSGSEAVAIDAGTGAELWRAGQLNHPTAAEGVLIGGRGAGPGATVQAVDAATGTALWNAPGRPSYGDVWALGDGAAYVLDRGVVAHDLRTGEERWRRDDVREPWAAGNGVVYVGWERVVFALEAEDGTSRWMLRPPLVGESWMTELMANSRSAFIAVDNFAPTD